MKIEIKAKLLFHEQFDSYKYKKWFILRVLGFDRSSIKETKHLYCACFIVFEPFASLYFKRFN